MENLDFENLADVPMIDEVQDTDTVLVVRDGEVFRADGGNLGGGGGYVVIPDAADIHKIEDGAMFAIDTPVPGIMDAIKSGQPISVAFDADVAILGGEFGTPLMTTATLGSCADILPLLDDMVAGLIDCLPYGTMALGYFGGGGILYGVMFTNGHYAELNGDEASVSTLSLDGEETETPLSKLKAAMAKVKEKLGGGL